MPTAKYVVFPIINKLGGLNEAHRKLNEIEKLEHVAEAELTKLTRMRMWERADRALIPGDVARRFMRIAEREQIPYSSADFYPIPDPRPRKRGRRPTPQPEGE